MPAVKYGKSHKEQLRQTIDRVLPESQNYEDFLAKMRAEGYEVKEGRKLSFALPGWDRFTRSNKLGDEYTREALMERANRPHGRSAEAGKPVEKPVRRYDRKFSRLIDIQAKIAQGKGTGEAVRGTVQRSFTEDQAA